MTDLLQPLLGLPALLGIALMFSERPRAVSWRRAAAGLCVTLLCALLMLKVPGAAVAFAAAGRAIDGLAQAARAGSSFVFGYLGGAPLPFAVTAPGADFILAFQAMPIVLVMSVLTTLLFHWRILPPIVRGFSFLLRRSLGVGGAVGVSTAANVFLGMVEAPLFIRPYLAGLSRADLFMVMTGGMAGIAGTVLVLYATLLGPLIPDAAGHFIVASVLGAPAAILVAQIMVPPQGAPAAGSTDATAIETPAVAEGTMDAIVKGTAAGLELFLNICAMLIVLVALVHLANAVLSLLPEIAGAPVSLQRMLGLAMAPLCWLMGIPWAEARTAGALMGTKTILNEFVAYLDLARLPSQALSPRSRLILLYALCGFANFGSLGIMIAGLTTMAPQRRADILSLGPKSIVAGTLATMILGAVIGLLA